MTTFIVWATVIFLALTTVVAVLGVWFSISKMIDVINGVSVGRSSIAFAFLFAAFHFADIALEVSNDLLQMFI